MMEYVNSKRKGVLPGQGGNGPATEEETLKRLYEVIGGSLAKGEKGIDLNTSIIMSYFEIDDFTIYTSMAILTAYMIGLKVLTYYVLLAKLNSTK